jgi:glycosyltransferase involved in cell wall biosynthesis
MNVALVAEGFAVDAGVGTERYSWELREGLLRKGIQVASVASQPSRQRYALAMKAMGKVPLQTLKSLRHTSIVHATDPSSGLILPFLGQKTVLTFHDLMPLILREANYGIADRMFSAWTYHMASGCDAIIAVSAQTKEDIVRYLHVKPNKITVINEGVSETFRRLPGVRKDNATIGYVGDLNPRKRIEFLLEGFSILKTKYLPEAKLLIVGTNIANYLGFQAEKLRRMVNQLDLTNAVTFVGHVSEQRLVELYNIMTVNVLPSDYEGFGFPILEAARCGTPTVTRKGSRISAEVCESTQKVGTTLELAEMLQALCEDKALFDASVQRAESHARRFSWDRCVSETVRAYERVLSS